MSPLTNRASNKFYRFFARFFVLRVAEEEETERKLHSRLLGFAIAITMTTTHHLRRRPLGLGVLVGVAYERCNLPRLLG